MLDPYAIYTAFEGSRHLASGALAAVLSHMQAAAGREGHEPILLFDDATGQQIDVALQGSLEDVLARAVAPATPVSPVAQDGEQSGGDETAPRGRGRPRLGVVAREVTLLPRHWEWLAGQPGGASVALRKLVEAARTAGAGRDRRRRAQEAAYRFMLALAGNQPGYEEALRALYSGDAAKFTQMTADWPVDVRDHARRLAQVAFEAAAAA